MVPGLLITSVVTVVMSAALFTRRSRTGWLDELADIRGGALAEPTDELDQAVAADDDAREEWRVAPPESPTVPPVEPVAAIPHPLRPHEVWHAHDGLGREPRDRREGRGVEERVAGEDLQGDGVSTGDAAPRFRFARLRPVGEELCHEAPVAPVAVPPATGDDPEAPPAPTAPGELFLHDHAEAEPAGTDDPAAVPLVPITIGRSTSGLSDGPVRRGRRRPRRTSLDTAVDPWQVLGLDGPEQDDVESPPTPVELVVGSDGTLAVAGTIRFDPDGWAAATRQVDGTVTVDLARGWCWTVAAEPVRLATPGGELTVPTDTSTLSVVEADGATFVVVVEGEAVLVHPGGRLRLRAGAMVLAPADGEPQVDVATEAEIAADPLVARNRHLDAAG